MRGPVVPSTPMVATALDEFSGVHPSFRQLFELGRGGMARVYLAESLASGIRKLVVLKILNPEFCADPDARAAFRREAELSAQMNHPNVVQVMAVVEYSNTPIIVMEYLDGEPLSVLLKSVGKKVPLRLQMYILAQVLAGLHHFHELRDLDGTPLNAVHRDMSPQNVMVLHDGPVKVLDFGIAKINASNCQVTRTGLIKGKLQYMPPEQLLGGASVDRRADIFAVGVMLWEAIADRRMWEGKSEVELLRGLATGALPKLREFAPEVPDSVLKIVDRAIDIDRLSRFATALEMQEAIERVLTQEGWFVQPRDIAELMQRHFGESRRAQELKIKRSLQSNQSGTNLMLDSISAARLRKSPERRPDPGNPTAGLSNLAILHPLRWGKYSWVWAIALTFCLGLALAWAIRRQTGKTTHLNDQASPRTVALEVDVLPRGAEISLDGKRLGRDHFSGQQPVTDSKLILEVSAPGYLSERKTLTLTKSMSLQFVLVPDPAVAKAAVSAPVSSVGLESHGSSAAPRARVLSQKGPRPTQKSGTFTSGNRSRSCNPPYTFGSDGVKTYKPECF
jgi:eukaryotic-like serine/threonine-protein kinase